VSAGRLASTVVSGLFVGALLVIAAGALWLGWDYYPLPRDERSGHELHALLQAGGALGVGLGVAGTALMVAMLLYSLRKAWTRADWMGSLAGWLRFHIVCGVMGPIFIVLHGGLVWPRGLIALGFWCMVLVGVSGVFGRYVYSFFPRTAGGRVLQYEGALDRLADLRAELVASTASARGDAVGQAVELVTGFEQKADGVLDLLRLGREARRRQRAVDRRLAEAELEPDARRRARRLLADQLRMKRGLEGWQVAGRLLRYWHLFHRPLAGAMYVIVALHVAVAIIFGGSLTRLPGLWR
jgi:hypothetical protein